MCVCVCVCVCVCLVYLVAFRFAQRFLQLEITLTRFRYNPSRPTDGSDFVLFIVWHEIDWSPHNTRLERKTVFSSH